MPTNEEIQRAILKADKFVEIPENYILKSMHFGVSVGDYFIIEKTLSDEELASQAHYKLSYAASYFPGPFFEISHELLSYKQFKKWVEVYDRLAYSDLQAAWISTIIEPSPIMDLLDIWPTNREEYYQMLLLNQWFECSVRLNERELSRSNSTACQIDEMAVTIPEKFKDRIGSARLATFFYGKDRSFPTESNYSIAYQNCLELAKSVLFNSQYLPTDAEINQSSYYSLLVLADVYLKTNEKLDGEFTTKLLKAIYDKLDKNILLNQEPVTLDRMRTFSELLYKSKCLNLSQLSIEIKKKRVIYEGWRVPSISMIYEMAKTEAYLFCVLILLLEQNEILSDEATTDSLFSILLQLLMVQVNTCDNEYLIDSYYVYPILLLGIVCIQLLPSKRDIYLSALTNSAVSINTRQSLLKNLNL